MRTLAMFWDGQGKEFGKTGMEPIKTMEEYEKESIFSKSQIFNGSINKTSILFCRNIKIYAEAFGPDTP